MYKRVCVMKILQFEDLGLNIYVNFDKAVKSNSHYKFFLNGYLVSNCITTRKLKFVEKYEDLYYFTFE